MADENPKRLSSEDARSGATPKMTRYILPISLGLVVVFFIIIVASGWMR